MSDEIQKPKGNWKKWDIEKIPAGIWYNTRQIADFLGVPHKQVTNRVAPDAPRPLPEGLVTQRVTETRGTIVLIKRPKPRAPRAPKDV